MWQRLHACHFTALQELCSVGAISKALRLLHNLTEACKASKSAEQWEHLVGERKMPQAECNIHGGKLLT